MVRTAPPPGQTDPKGGYVVRCPRDYDALGMSLRHIFEIVPYDQPIEDLMRRLNAVN